MVDSDGVLAFREKMSGLVQEHTAVLDSVERDWTATGEAAEQTAKEQTEKAQQLAERVGQRAQAMRDAEADKGPQELSIGVEDEEPPEEDPEVEALSRGLLADRQTASAPEQPENPNPEGWQVQAGRFGRQAEEPPAPEPAPPAPPPRPAPRRRAVAEENWDDDDDDLSTRNWLR